MAIKAFPTKDPDSILDYGFMWGDWLDVGDIIVSSIWILPTGLTEDSSTFTDTTTTIWLRGGLLDEKYTVVNRITTQDGRTEDQSAIMQIKQH